jgi:hypothetical protein
MSILTNMERIDPQAYFTSRPDAVAEGYAKLVDTMDADGKANGGKQVVYIDPIKHECAMDHWKLKVKTETDTMEKYKLNGTSLFEIIRGQLDDLVLGKLAHDPEYQKALVSQCPIELLTLLKSTCSLGDGSTVNPKLARLQLFRKSVSFQQKPRHKTVSMETSRYKRTFEVHIDSVMEKSSLFAFGASWWEPFLKADSKTLVEFISMSQTEQNKYNSLVKDEIIGMLMIEGCDSEGLKNHLKYEYKINGKLDCYPTTSSKAADLIDSYIEVGGNNNNKNPKSHGNDNDDEEIAGIHTTDAPDNESLDNDCIEDEEPPDDLMIAALAAVQDGGQEDHNYYTPLDINDIDFVTDFGTEEVAGIHVAVEVQEELDEESSSESSSCHLSDHYYCPSDDDVYSTSSDDDESSNGRSMPGLQAQAAVLSSSDYDDSHVYNEYNDADNNDDDSIQGSIVDEDDDMLPSYNSFRATLDGRVERPQPLGFRQDAFSYDVTIPPPLTTPSATIPPVTCIIIPHDQDDVNSSEAAPIIERVNSAGRVPIRVQQDSFRHVDEVINHKPALLNIAGESVHNWTHFIESCRIFPTQVTVNQRILLDTGASLAISNLPNASLWQFQPKRAGVTQGRDSVDPPDFHQGEN